MSNLDDFNKRRKESIETGKPLKKKDFKKRLVENMTDREIRSMIRQAKKIAKTDKNMLKFLLEQVFGKPRQLAGPTEKEINKPTTMSDLLDKLESKKEVEVVDG